MCYNIISEKRELPEIIYKYVDWDDINKKKIITENEIYFSSPFEFNQLHECDFEIEGIQNDLNSVLKKYLKDKINSVVSIFCVSEHKNNLQLWDTFAKKHTGICVGLNTNKLLSNKEIDGSGGNVNYYTEGNKPKLKLKYENNNDFICDIMKVVFSLPAIYKEECEYRLTKNNLINKKVKINADIYEEIILGCGMSSPTKVEIGDIAAKMYPKVKIIEALYNHRLETLDFAKY